MVNSSRVNLDGFSKCKKQRTRVLTPLTLKEGSGWVCVGVFGAEGAVFFSKLGEER